MRSHPASTADTDSAGCDDLALSVEVASTRLGASGRPQCRSGAQDIALGRERTNTSPSENQESVAFADLTPGVWICVSVTDRHVEMLHRGRLRGEGDRDVRELRAGDVALPRRADGGHRPVGAGGALSVRVRTPCPLDAVSHGRRVVGRLLPSVC